MTWRPASTRRLRSPYAGLPAASWRSKTTMRTERPGSVHATERSGPAATISIGGSAAANQLWQRRAFPADRELDNDAAAGREVDAGGELVNERVAAVVGLGEQPADAGRLDEARLPDGGISGVELTAGQPGQERGRRVR